MTCAVFSISGIGRRGRESWKWKVGILVFWRYSLPIQTLSSSKTCESWFFLSCVAKRRNYIIGAEILGAELYNITRRSDSSADYNVGKHKHKYLHWGSDGEMQQQRLGRTPALPSTTSFTSATGGNWKKKMTGRIRSQRDWRPRPSPFFLLLQIINKKVVSYSMQIPRFGF